MSPINTENFFGISPLKSGRHGVGNFSVDQSAGESFDNHLRQAFQPAATSPSSQRHESEADSETQRDEHTDRNRRERHDDDASESVAVTDRGGDSVADDAKASSRTNSQDDSQLSDSEAIDTANGENRIDLDQTQNQEVVDQGTQQTQTISSDTEPVTQLVEDNSQQNLQTNMDVEQYAEQPSIDTDMQQSDQVVENMVAAEVELEAASGSADNAQHVNSAANAIVESTSDTTASEDVSQESSVDQLQTNQQDGDFADATLVTSGDAEKNSVAQAAEEVAQEMTTTGEEAAQQDVSAQSQVVAADKTSEDKKRRASDPTDASGEGNNQAPAAPLAAPLADTNAAESDGLKTANKAPDKITATDKETADSKATASQSGQNDMAITQRGQGGQETRSEAASQTVGGEEIDTTDRVRFVQRVARAFEGLGRDGGTMRMRLHPSELGSLSLEVSVRDGVLTAKMETETQAAKNILLDNMPALRDRLAQQDIKVQQFDVDYSGGNNGGSPQSAADQHQSHQQAHGRQATPQASGDVDIESESLPQARRLGQAAQLDFVA